MMSQVGQHVSCIFSNISEFVITKPTDSLSLFEYSLSAVVIYWETEMLPNRRFMTDCNQLAVTIIIMFSVLSMYMLI